MLYQKETLFGEDEAKVFLDLNEVDPSGTTSLAGTLWTDDGAMMAYMISKSGSDWKEIRVKDTSTGKD